MAAPFAVDMTGLPSVGLDAWLAREAVWPVGEADFCALKDCVFSGWLDALDGLSGEERDVMLSEGGQAWILQLAHAALVAAAVGGEGVELLAGPRAKPYYRPDWDALGRAHGDALRQPWPRLALRRQMRNLAFNRHLPVLRRAGGLVSPDAVALGSNDPLRRCYVRQRGLAVDNTYISLLARGARPVGLSSALRRATDAAAGGICARIAGRFGVEMDARGLGLAVGGRLATLAGVYRAARARAVRKPLLVTESAVALHKAAACGWRAGGGSAIGFHHGHSVGEMRVPDRALGEFFAYDEFVVHSEAAGEAFAADCAASALGGASAPRFVVADPAPAGDETPDWRVGFPSTVKRVMIMGFPMNAMRYPGFKGLFWAPQFELEVRLAKLLRSNGFEVLYKVHPETAVPVSGIMESLGCAVVPQRLEQVVDMADAFVVKYITTTTFPAVLRSARPVYLINTEDEAWNAEYFELLARRCVVLDAAQDEGGRIRFDERALVEGLSGPQEFPDYSYVKRYYTSAWA